MKALEMEMVIPTSGKLPAFFQEIFGQKVRLIALFEEMKENRTHRKSQSSDLMELAGKINSFRKIEDPVLYQQQMRDEWENRWEL